LKNQNVVLYNQSRETGLFQELTGKELGFVGCSPNSVILTDSFGMPEIRTIYLDYAFWVCIVPDEVPLPSNDQVPNDGVAQLEDKRCTRTAMVVQDD